MKAWRVLAEWDNGRVRYRLVEGVMVDGDPVLEFWNTDGAVAGWSPVRGGDPYRVVAQELVRRASP